MASGLVTGIIFFVITLFALAGLFRSIKRGNLFGGGYSFIVLAVFGWFSVMTIYAAVWGGGAVSE